MKSLQRHLLSWVLGALALGAVVLALVTYVFTLQEMDEVFDETLKQTALALADYEHSDVVTPQRAGAAPTLDYFAHPGDAEIVTITWALDGQRRFISDPRLHIPIARSTGLATTRVDNVRWYVYTVVETNGIVQAAQRAGARRQAAAEAAAKLFGPLFLLVAFIGALLAFALRRGLQPLDLAVQDVVERSANSMRPITLAGLPQEIHPLVRAINDLLSRLSVAFEAQKRFVADAAHELRTPVTALRLQLKLLDRAGSLEEREVAAQELAQGVARAEHLIAQLLHLSRVEPGADTLVAQPVSLGELVREAVATFSLAAERKRIDLGARVEQEMSVRGDLQQLTVLLNNLVDNALRHSPAGTVVDVVVCRLDDRPVLRVIDTGPGIREEIRGRVFERFFRGEAPAGGPAEPPGSGLGLAIVWAIAERHQAAIELRDGPPDRAGRGLEVRVAFAADSALAAADSGQPEAPRHAAAQLAWRQAPAAGD